MYVARFSGRLPGSAWYWAFLLMYRQHRIIVCGHKNGRMWKKRRTRGLNRQERDARDRALLRWAAEHGHGVIVSKVLRSVAQKTHGGTVEDYLLHNERNWPTPLHEVHLMIVSHNNNIIIIMMMII